MKKLYLLFIFFSISVMAQNGSYSVDATYFYGNIVPHSKTIYHLITGHPEGVFVSLNKKTFGEKKWQQDYNFPDLGLSFHYQDMKNESLGEMYGLYTHYNFYFFNRYLTFRPALGIAYNTNPYDKETNFRNEAYGMSFMPSIYFMLNYTKQDIWQGLGFHTGFSFVHFSNGSMKAPNTSTNTFALNLGLNYTFERKDKKIYDITLRDTVRYTEPVKLNLEVKGGITESDVVGTGQYPYYAVSVYADKRWMRKSAFQIGADVFWPKYIKEFIKFRATSFPELHLDPETDYRKIGMFVGHELFINRLSFEVQAGFYVYSPYKETGSHYQRVGLKYYISDEIFGSMTLKTHAANAEVLEFGVGVRL